MPLRPISELIQHAREYRYALGYFESWNFESLQGVLDAAEAIARAEDSIRELTRGGTRLDQARQSHGYHVLQTRTDNK